MCTCIKLYIIAQLTQNQTKTIIAQLIRDGRPNPFFKGSEVKDRKSNHRKNNVLLDCFLILIDMTKHKHTVTPCDLIRPTVFQLLEISIVLQRANLRNPPEHNCHLVQYLLPLEGLLPMKSIPVTFQSNGGIIVYTCEGLFPGICLLTLARSMKSSRSTSMCGDQSCGRLDRSNSCSRTLSRVLTCRHVPTQFFAY